MKAEEYNLTGWVRNIPDNKVDGEAQGDEKGVAALLEYVKEGPKLAHVVKLETADRDLVDGEQGFVVRR
ncbi:related to Acylphosphatase [Cephalotrichum gorgonifer]|uniref:Related to Acylphosphatase n=1 Tax=Cephalotrichum gorgonifer TaxID=2041049 RepID=A0AAE8SR02_9PEZI|nr:related to Acylphosphatase [Cephalotrichum gorgonifer]